MPIYRSRLAVVLLLVASLLGVDFALAPQVEEAAAQDEPDQLPVEKAEKGDPGPLPSTPRDFAKEFPVGEQRPEKTEGADGGPVAAGGTRDLKKVREITDKRTEATETFLMEDGSSLTEVSVVPKWYRNGKGGWAKVDNRVVADPDRPGGFRNEGAAWSVQFGSVAEGISYEIEGQKFTAKLAGGAKDVMPERDEKDNTVIWYRDVWPGVDVSYRISAAAVKEDFHVGSAEGLRAAGRFESEWSSEGRLVPDEMLEGGLRLDWDGDGKAPADQQGPKVSIEPIRVFDAKGAPIPAAKGRHGVDLAREEQVAGKDAASTPTARRFAIDLDSAWVESLTAESFPLVVDPTVNISPSAGGGWASYSAMGNSIGTSQFPLVGDGGQVWGGSDEWRFGVYYDYSQIWTNAPGARVRYSDLQFDTNQYPQPVGVFNSNPASVFYNGNYPSSGNSSAVGVCHANAWSFAGMWMGWSPSLCKNYGYAYVQPQWSNLAGHPSTTWVETAQYMRPWVDGQSNQGVFGVKVDTTPGYTFHAVMPTLRIWWDRQSTPAPLAAPDADATVTSLTPTMSWGTSTDADPGENPPVYSMVLMGGKPLQTPTDQYELSGCTQGASRLWSTPYSGSTSAQIPAGVLSDGATYYWVVTSIGGGGIDRYPRCSEVRRFTVNKRLGTSGPFPIEQLGPVGVNLINGNVIAASASHGYTTVASDQSVSFVYNSQRTQDRGLRGRYYGGVWPLWGTDPDVWNTPGAKFADRLDATVDFNWGYGSPVPTLDSMDNFRATWTGYVTVPTAGNYCFGGTFDDGVRITLNGTVVLNKWQDQAANFDCSNGVTASYFAAGETKSIVVDYFEHKAGAAAQLRWSISGGGVAYPVDSSWLSPELNVLGPGWTMSAGAVSVQGALKTDTGVTLRGADGSTTEYRKSDSGAYTGPPNDGTIVRVDPVSGQISVLDDAGTTYKFSADGELQSAVTAIDDRAPAATQYVWSGAPIKLTGMTDPVSGNTSVLRYGGDGACPSLPPTGGFVTAPSKLCSVTTPDGRVTQLFYDSDARLARIVQPGGVTADYGYTGTQLTGVREPLAYDAVVAGKRTDGAGVRWTVGYTGDKATTVTPPQAIPSDTAQPVTVNYVSSASTIALGETRLSVAGADQPLGFSKKVTFDHMFRTRGVTDVSGTITATAYDGNFDRPSWIDTLRPNGVTMRSSTIYDTSVVFNGLSRPFKTYGPAPASMFQANSPEPQSGFLTQVPSTTTNYDGGLTGLLASWSDDTGAPGTIPNRAAFIGAPKLHTLFNPGSTLNWNIGAAAPETGIPGDYFSLRLTGLVNIPTAGTWQFSGSADDGLRVTIDDVLAVDTWTAGGAWQASPAMSLASGWHRITVDYREDAGGASFGVGWLPPGGAWANLPVASLKPDLGLVTSMVDSAGLTSTTGFADPVAAQATSTVVDPGGLNLTSTTTYETRGTVGQFMRRTARTLPSGASSANAYTSYAPGEVPPAPACAGTGVSVSPPAQRGLPKTSKSADPTTSGGGGGLVREQIADTTGRTVATRISTDAEWSCTSFDTRGRVTATTYPTSAATTSGGASTPGNIPPSGTRIKVAHSGKCLDVRNISSNNNEYVDQWSCYTSGAANQLYDFTDLDGTWFTMKPQHSGMCIGVDSNSTANGALIRQQTCSGGAAQKWKAQATGTGYQLINQNSSKCIEVPSNSMSDGTATTQNTCGTSSNTNQIWQFVHTSTHASVPFPTVGGGGSGTPGNIPPSGTRVKVQHSGQCLDIRNISSNNGEYVDQYSCYTSGATNQVFDFVDLDGTWFTMKPQHSGMCIGVPNNTAGSFVQQQTCTGANSQKWKAVATGSGYQLINQSSNLCIEVPGSSMSYQTATTQNTCGTGSTTNQIWQFVNSSTLATVAFPSVGGGGGTAYGERTVTNSYAIGGDPFLSSVTDPAGTITTRVDLLGRVTDTKDTLGIVTHTDYNATTKRVSQVTVFNSSGTVLSRTSSTFKSTGPEVGQVATERWSNAATTVSGYDFTNLVPSTAMPTPGSWMTLSTAHYDTTGRNDYTDYLNGVRSTFGIDSWERAISVTHTKGATTLYSDVVTRDKTGRVVDRTVNGTDPRPSNPNYVYDNAGRLTDWWERDVNSAANAYGTYRFGYSGSNFANTCGSVTGASSSAGLNSNRAEETLTTSSGTVTSVYCYDFADRIQKVSKSSGTNPYTGGFVYDAHGNTTTVGAETWSFDGANRHLKTVNGSTNVEYTRDALDRIVGRKVNGTTVSKQVHTGSGDTGDLVLDSSNNLKELTIVLSGGSLYTWRPSSGDVWSHTNTHGDLILTTNSSGTQTGTTGSYDPFGNPLGSTSIDNGDGNLDYGWHGQAQRPLEHETGLNPTIEMGARPYQSALGRFFAVDPIEGGTPNDYVYATDPIGLADLNGQGQVSYCAAPWRWAACADALLLAQVLIGYADQTGARYGWDERQTNAFRHGVWMALIVFDGIGDAGFARGLGLNHESDNSTDAKTDKQNNNVGIGTAQRALKGGWTRNQVVNHIAKMVNERRCSRKLCFSYAGGSRKTGVKSGGGGYVS